MFKTMLKCAAAGVAAIALTACAHTTAAAPETASVEAAVPEAAGKVQLGFFKIITKDQDAMQAFYEDTFGFKVVNHFEFPGIDERIMTVPGQSLSLVLYHHTDGREITMGNAYGPIGLVTHDVDALYAEAIAAGATPKTPPYDLGDTGVRLGFVLDPEGHEIEFIRLAEADH